MSNISTQSQSYFIGDLRAPLGQQSSTNHHALPNDLGVSVFEQNLKKDPVFYPVNTFAFLFAQTIEYYQHRVDTIRQLEEKLSYLGRIVWFFE